MRTIPRTIVNCTPTLAVATQRSRAAFDADHLCEIDTGHGLMVTEPEATAEMLGRLAAHNENS